jgi:O-antigen ligase/polysaccharide polymerase Wzy-like membrane protein
MSSGAYPASWSGRLQPSVTRSVSDIVLFCGACLALLLGGLSLGVLLDHNPPSAAVVLGGGLALLLAIALVLLRYELAIALGFFLLAVVLVEPAPSDALFGVVMAVSLVTTRFPLRRAPHLALYLVAGFLVLNVLSVMDVLDWASAARFFLITLYLGLFSLWLAVYLDRPSRARRLARAYLAAAVISAVAASAALFIHFPGSSALITNERAKALFKDPNVYGPFLVPIAMILIEELLKPRLLRLRRLFMLASFLALTLGVVFSYSRAAWLNFAVATIVLIGIVTLRRPGRRAASLVLVVLLSGLAIAGAIVGTGSLGFLEERARLQNYDAHRFAAQSRGVTTGFEHPLGIGPGQFDIVSPVSSHSLYVRSLSEQGLLGLFVIIAMLLMTLVFATMNVVNGSDTYGISAAALMAAWCGLLANSFFVDTLHWRHLWLVAALIWAGAIRRRRALPAPLAS